MNELSVLRETAFKFMDERHRKQIEKVNELCNKGYTISQIAAELGVKKSTVINYIPFLEKEEK